VHRYIIDMIEIKIPVRWSIKCNQEGAPVTRRYKHLLIAILTLRTLDISASPQFLKKKQPKLGDSTLSLPGIILDSSSSYVYVYLHK
jgi:hypothetical protein